MKCILMLIAGILIGVISTHPVSAHTASYGYSKWYINDKDIEFTMVIDDISILELGQIDSDSDGKLSLSEVENGYNSIIKPYMDKGLIIKANGEVIPSEILTFDIVNDNELLMKFRAESKWAIETVQIDYQLFFDNSKNMHKNIALIYLPGSPEKHVENIFQSSSPSWEMKVSEDTSVWSSFASFIFLGIEHILTGYDHILFLLSLIVIGLTMRQTLGIITSFTIAHSITLILATLEIVQLNSRWVEITIALTICYIAVENIIRRQVKYRWVLTFVFGLVHGFGFSNVLQEIAIPRSGLLASLLGFNLGVEIGQFMFIIVCLPLLYLLGKFISNRKITIGSSLIIFIFGFIWFLERQFEFTLLGF